MGQSEVAQMRERIEAEMVAMRRGMYGFAAGTARHDFIKARMDNIGSYQEKLAEQVGDEEAWQFCAQTYTRVATYLKRLAELVGACEAHRIMLFIYMRVFEEERQRRGERCT